MAKNRQQLELEAEELGLDPTEYSTNAELAEAIDAENKDNSDTENNEETPKETEPVAKVEVPSPPANVSEGETHVYEPGVGEVRVGGGQPSDEVQFTEATPEAESMINDGKGFRTTKAVRFNINGKDYAGTSFSFDSDEETEARKQMLVERYGSNIIAPDEEEVE